jgi:hypothetical protein
MENYMKLGLPTLILLTLVLTGACAPATMPAATPNVDEIYTAAARTVVAEFTLTASGFTPTSAPPTETETPEPDTTTTVTATTLALVTDPTLIALGTPGTLCDSLSFGTDVDVTIPDGSSMTKGQDFIKTWKITNDGACAWGDGYGLIYAYGERMAGEPVPLGTVVEAGQAVEVSVNLKAPALAGEYLSAWQMANSKGVPFGKALFVKIIVQ